MHHRITYMCINFQQNWVSRPVKIVCTNIFANICKLHKFATIPIIFFNQLLQACIIKKRTCISIVSKIGFVEQSKPCTQIYLQKIASCLNLQPPIVFFLNRLFETCVIVTRTCISIFSKLGLLDQSKPCTLINL